MANVKTIIHLSDIHIGKTRREKKRAEAIFEWIKTTHPGLPILITGDLTESGTAKQFGKMRELLEGLPKTTRILTVPGNHDYAFLGIAGKRGARARWSEHLAAPLEGSAATGDWLDEDHCPEGVDGLGIVEDAPWVFFGIDSGDPHDEVALARGCISPKVRDRLAQELSRYDGGGWKRVVFLHHHPFMRKTSMALKGAGPLMDVLKDNCELLLFGHKHDYGIWHGEYGIPLIVASHKSTNLFAGECLAVTFIDITDKGELDHRMEVIQFKRKDI